MFDNLDCDKYWVQDRKRTKQSTGSIHLNRLRKNMVRGNMHKVLRHGQGWEFVKEKKRKQENTHSSKKTRTCLHEKKNSLKKTYSRPRKRPRKRSRKKEKLSLFCGRFLGRERVFLSEFFFFRGDTCVFSWTSARFLVFLLSFFFFYKFPALSI